MYLTENLLEQVTENNKLIIKRKIGEHSNKVSTMHNFLGHFHVYLMFLNTQKSEFSMERYKKL